VHFPNYAERTILMKYLKKLARSDRQQNNFVGFSK